MLRALLQSPADVSAQHARGTKYAGSAAAGPIPQGLELIARVFNGKFEGLTRDDILDNITLTWLTNTAISGALLYWENMGASFFAVKGVSPAVPVAVSVFPD
jgi:hypothetical protein